jgi:hypothetical protein
MLQDKELKLRLKKRIRGNLRKAILVEGIDVTKVSESFQSSLTAVYDVLSDSEEKLVSLKVEDLVIFGEELGISQERLLEGTKEIYRDYN